VFIESAAFCQTNSTSDPYVKGQIAIEGEFWPAEWEAIREAFIAMGLIQVTRLGQKPSQMLPSRAECLDAFREGPDAIKKLEEKYPLMLEYGK